MFQKSVKEFKDIKCILIKNWGAETGSDFYFDIYVG